MITLGTAAGPESALGGVAVAEIGAGEESSRAVASTEGGLVVGTVMESLTSGALEELSASGLAAMTIGAAGTARTNS